jgi:uncharacterized delta-60 repeat protein
LRTIRNPLILQTNKNKKNMRYIYISILLLLAGFAYAQGPVLADETFNGTGQNTFMVNNSQSSYGYDIKVMADDKILMSGVYKPVGSNYFKIALVKFLSDGATLDNSFGVNGVADVSLGNQSAIGGMVNRIKIDANGNIYVIGYGRPAIGVNKGFVCRFLPTGLIDNTFGTAGIFMVNVSGVANNPEQFCDIDIDASGNLYLTGIVRTAVMPPNIGLIDIIIVKLTSAGVLDPSFSGDGMQLNNFFVNQWEYAYGIHVLADGKIIVGGHGGFPANAMAIRFNADGTLDNTFGTNGMTTVDIIGTNVADEIYSMLVQPDGKIVLAGLGVNQAAGSKSESAIVRLNSDGSVDNTFGGGDGIFTHDVSGSNASDGINKIILMPDGRYLCGGWSLEAGSRDFAVMRVNANGTLDNTFNNGTGVYKKEITGLTIDDELNGIDIQSDTKILLGGVSILASGISTRWSMMRIIPDAVEANFSASLTTVCSGSTVQFTDNSLGANIQRSWTFEGGTPATSTAQNPVVTYAAVGIYDVKLVVSNINMADSLTITDMLTVHTTPVAPAVPSGPASLCNLNTAEYSITAIPTATSYNWLLEPTQAGVLTPNGLTATFVSSTYIGPYTIKVNAQNECGLSTWAVKSCQLNDAPSLYVLQGPGYYCQGTSGQTITLSNSENGVNYELLLENTPTGNIKTGTGSTIQWNNITAQGFYTAKADNGCVETMAGQVYNLMMTTPAQASAAAGLNSVCNNATSTYTTAEVATALSYLFTLSPANAGTIAVTGTQVEIAWNTSFSGTANLTVQAVNECGNGVASPAFAITVNDTPEPAISGLTIVCQNWNADYQTEVHTGSSYIWTVTGGSIVAGANTAAVSVNWNSAGSGTLKVAETTASNCTGTSAVFNVAVDACVGLDELAPNETLVVYPNPAQSNVTVKLNQKAGNNSQLRIIDATGRQVAGFVIDNGTSIVEGIDISNLKSGFYTLLYITDGMVVSQTKVVKN